MYGSSWGALVTVGALLFAVCLLLRRGSHSDDHLVWNAHEHEDARTHELWAWRDCTGRAPSGSTLKRAYRRLALEAHPDKDGSSAQFQALDAAHKHLQSPVQYNLRASFTSNYTFADGHGVKDVRLATKRADDGVRIQLAVDFTSAAARGYWKFGLLAKDVSSIEYSGQGLGYDVCCEFLENSRCKYKPYTELVAQHKAHTDGAWDSMYIDHDCPLRAERTYTGIVDKPLHVPASGLWAAVLELMDTDGKEMACAAVTFRLEGDELQPILAAKEQL